MKVDSFSESTDKSVLSSNRQSFYFPECENLNFSDWNLKLVFGSGEQIITEGRTCLVNNTYIEVEFWVYGLFFEIFVKISDR